MRKTKIFTLFVMLYLVFSITAFAAATKEEVKTGPEKIQFYHAIPGKNGEIFEGMVADFNGSQNEVLVEPIFIADYVTIAQKLTASIASNTAPALTQLTDSYLVKFASSGVLASMDDFMAKPDFQNIKSDYVQGFIDATTVGGNVYGLPMVRSTPVLYYRKDMLRENGIDVSQLETYEGLREASIKLVKAGTVKYGVEPLKNPWFMVTALRSNNVELFNSDYSEATFGTAEGIEVFQYFHDLVHKDKAAFVHYGGTGWQYWVNSQYDLVNGTAAMYTGSTGDMGGGVKRAAEFGIPPEEIGLAFMPRFENGEFSVPFGGTSGSIVENVSPEQKAAAWKFLLWFSKPENSASWSEATGYLPTRYSSKDFLDLEANPNLGIAINQLKHAEPEPTAVVWSEIREGALQALIDKIFLEEDLDVAAAVAAGVKEANEAIKNQ